MLCICFLAQIQLWNSQGSTDGQKGIFFAERKTVVNIDILLLLLKK